VKILKQLLKETEDDINHIASMQNNTNIMNRIPIMLEKLKKETGYGIPEKNSIPTKSL